MTTELIHALKWLPWKDAGFPTDDRCPYVGYREMRRGKHKPKPEIEKVARQLLDEKNPKQVHNSDTRQEETHMVKSIKLVITEGTPTLIGKIDGYSGSVWYSPDSRTWIMVHHPLEGKIDKNLQLS